MADAARSFPSTFENIAAIARYYNGNNHNRPKKYPVLYLCIQIKYGKSVTFTVLKNKKKKMNGKDESQCRFSADYFVIMPLVNWMLIAILKIFLLYYLLYIHF